MKIEKKNSKLYLLIFFLVILILFFFLITKNFLKTKTEDSESISINLLTSVHPNLSWNFKPIKPTITIIPGEVTTIEYVVENLGNKETTGIATFAYFPSQFEMK